MIEHHLNKKILSLIALLNSDSPNPEKTSCLGNADWPALMSTIKQTGMAGYFSSLFLQRQDCLAIPFTASENLDKSARRVAALNVFYETECAHILRGLSSVGVANILLKGLSYMEDIYGDTSARTMSDIDLLIRPADRLKVLEYLTAEGYSNYVIPLFQGKDDDFSKLTDIIGEAHFMKKSGALTINIDLHWKMRAGYPMSDYLALDKLPWWENTGAVVIENTTARRLSPEMQFMHLALHFALHHQYTGLRWFIELVLFLKRYGNELDWDFIYKTASTEDCRKLLGVCLRLSADFLGESWPGASNRQKLLPDRTLLPGEYRFYKRCLMRQSRSRLSSYACMPLFPATIKGRLGMIHHFFFDPQGVMFWHGSKTEIPGLLRPFYNLYIIASQLLRGRKT
jgi:hypothetical protein